MTKPFGPSLAAAFSAAALLSVSVAEPVRSEDGPSRIETLLERQLAQGDALLALVQAQRTERRWLAAVERREGVESSLASTRRWKEGRAAALTRWEDSTGLAELQLDAEAREARQREREILESQFEQAAGREDELVLELLAAQGDESRTRAEWERWEALVAAYQDRAPR